MLQQDGVVPTRVGVSEERAGAAQRALEGGEAQALPHMSRFMLGFQAHNWYRIRRLTLTRDGPRYRVTCTGTVEFSREGVACDESFTFQAMATFRGHAQ